MLSLVTSMTGALAEVESVWRLARTRARFLFAKGLSNYPVLTFPGKFLKACCDCYWRWKLSR